MLYVIFVLIIIGVIMWAVNAYIPMDPPIKKILNIVVVICVILWLLQIFGVFGYLSAPAVPRLHHP